MKTKLIIAGIVLMILVDVTGCARPPKAHGTWSGTLGTKAFKSEDGRVVHSSTLEIQNGPPLNSLMSTQVVLVDKKFRLILLNPRTNHFIKAAGVIRLASPIDPSSGEHLTVISEKSEQLTVAAWVLQTSLRRIEPQESPFP